MFVLVIAYFGDVGLCSELVVLHYDDTIPGLKSYLVYIRVVCVATSILWFMGTGGTSGYLLFLFFLFGLLD
jgi:hypothetical protein